MLISELAKEVHMNAVAHGWWDEERETPEIIALIHSEWSEALEEARAGRPMVYKLDVEGDNLRYVTPQDARYTELHTKPEGVAVELIDGVIRILDFLGKLNAEFHEKDNSPSTVEGLYSDSNVAKISEKASKASHIVAFLHLYTSFAFNVNNNLVPANLTGLLEAMTAALSWVKKQGLDPLAILLEKHEYNKTRPYKHGKKF